MKKFLRFRICFAVIILPMVFAKLHAQQPLKVGADIPDKLWSLKLPVVKRNSNKPTIMTLGGVKDRLILLDFWATWCASCISGFPKLRALEEEFDETVSVVPVSHNNAVEVRNFLIDHFQGPVLGESVAGDTILKSYFPHKYIPHIVWIFEGKILAITDALAVSKENIKTVLAKKPIPFPMKNDILEFNRFHPFSANLERVFKGSLIAQTTLTTYVDGLGASGATAYSADSSLIRKNYINARLIDIYNLAVDKPVNHFVNEATDKTKFENLESDPYWGKNHVYCYEIIRPSTMPKSRWGPFVINDLNAKLGLNSRMEMREMDVYILMDDEANTERSSIIDGKELQDIGSIVSKFNHSKQYVDFNYKYNPIIINECKRKTDLQPPPYDAFLNIEEFRRYVLPQGVKIVSAKRLVEVFVLSD